MIANIRLQRNGRTSGRKKERSENKSSRICRSKPLKNLELELKLKIYGVEVFEQEGMAHGESSEHRERVEG